MRIFIRAAIVLVILVAAYWGWALAGAAQLASAASRGDAEAVLQRVDLQAIIRSLSSQISRTYLDQNPQLHGLAGGVVVNAAAAEMLLRAFLTPENIAALLNEGRGAFPDSGASIWRMPLLSEAFRTGPWQALMNSYFNGPLSFVVDLDSAEGRYGVHLHLSGMTWRLSGLDLPEQVSARLAREIAQRVGGSIERRGG
jgi:hypothetical protein